MVSEVEVVNESIKVITQSDNWQIALTIATVIVASVAIGTLIVSYFNTKNQLKETRKSNELLEDQLLTSNFEVITTYIGNPLTKECRGIIHNSEKFLEELAKEEQYKKIKDIKLKRYNVEYNAAHFNDDDIEKEKKLRMLLEPIRYVCSIYERVGFLLEENPKMKKRFIPYHRKAILKIWNKVEKIIELENKYNDNDKKYPKFEQLVGWCKSESKID